VVFVDAGGAAGVGVMVPDRRVADQGGGVTGEAGGVDGDTVSRTTAMSMTSPDRIVLRQAQRRELTGVLRSGRGEQRLALRARIVLPGADGQPTTVIAAAVRGGGTTDLADLLRRLNQHNPAEPRAA
jgi:hypothetical protein